MRTQRSTITCKLYGAYACKARYTRVHLSTGIPSLSLPYRVKPRVTDRCRDIQDLLVEVCSWVGVTNVPCTIEGGNIRYGDGNTITGKFFLNWFENKANDGSWWKDPSPSPSVTVHEWMDGDQRSTDRTWLCWEARNNACRQPRCSKRRCRRKLNQSLPFSVSSFFLLNFSGGFSRVPAWAICWDDGRNNVVNTLDRYLAPYAFSSLWAFRSKHADISLPNTVIEFYPTKIVKTLKIRLSCSGPTLYRLTAADVFLFLKWTILNHGNHEPWTLACLQC